MRFNFYTATTVTATATATATVTTTAYATATSVHTSLTASNYCYQSLPWLLLLQFSSFFPFFFSLFLLCK